MCGEGHASSVRWRNDWASSRGRLLETVACIGACALAPTMRIGKETYGQMTTRKVTEVFGAKEKAGQRSS
jgi:NADH:ubiquinone oxidoreductase subunit E